MRRISRYVLSEFIGPFFFAFVVITLVLIVDFVPDVVKLVIKKELNTWVIIKVFVLNLAWMLALSIPMAVLAGTLMSFGRLASDGEVLAIKAAGISPLRILLPVLTACLILGVGLVYFNNEVLPDANHYARQLMSDIKRTRPVLEIKENVLTDQIAGYHLLVRGIDYRTSRIEDVAIFDHKTRQTPRTITARHGRLAFAADGRTLIVELHDGEIHESDPQTPEKYRRMKFDHQTFYLAGAGSEFSSTDSKYRTDREKSAAAMMADIRKWRALIPAHHDAILERVTEAVSRLIQPPLPDSILPPDHRLIAMAGRPLVIDSANAKAHDRPPSLRRRLVDESDAIKRAISINSRVANKIKQEIRGIDNQHRLISTFLLEVHKKYSLPAACVVFVLIGGPLGILARRGGIGVGLGLSLGMFVMYWAFLIGGEDLSDRGLISPAVAMWTANVLIGGVGLLLLWRVIRDAPLRLPGLFRRLVEKVQRRFGDGAPAKRQAIVRRKTAFCPPGMRRLSFYVLRSFLFNLLWAQAAFWFIFILIDMIERLDKFIDRGIQFSQVLNYYIYFTPYILTLTLPIAMLLATLFCVGFMARRNELLAVRAAGIPLWRLAGPLFSVALVIVLLVMAAGEFVLPWADQHRESWKREKLRGIVDHSGVLISNLYTQGHDGRVFYFRTYEPRTGTGTDVLVQTFDRGRLSSTTQMASLRFEDSLWIGQKGRVRVFSNVDTLTGTPDFAPFTSRTFGEWTEVPQDFTARRVSPENMGYRDLYRYIKAKQAMGVETTAERTDFQWKFSFPLINMVIVLFGLPIAVRVRQSGMALNFGIAMGITFIFRVMIEIFRAFGHNGDLSPFVSAWAPVGIFLVAGLFMLSRIKN